MNVNTPRLITSAIELGVLYIIVMSNNPYLDQLCAQTGMTPTEARRETRLNVNPITDEVAQARGYDTADEYLEALNDFLNAN